MLIAALLLLRRRWAGGTACAKLLPNAAASLATTDEFSPSRPMSKEGRLVPCGMRDQESHRHQPPRTGATGARSNCVVELPIERGN